MLAACPLCARQCAVGCRGALRESDVTVPFENVLWWIKTALPGKTILSFSLEELKLNTFLHTHTKHTCTHICQANLEKITFFFFKNVLSGNN